MSSKRRRFESFRETEHLASIGKDFLGRYDAARFGYRVTLLECCDGRIVLSVLFPASDELSHGLRTAIGQAVGGEQLEVV